MTHRLATLARRRPGLVVLFSLYATIAVLVARSPLTVAVCIVLLLSVAGQIIMSVRGSQPRSSELRSP